MLKCFRAAAAVACVPFFAGTATAFDYEVQVPNFHLFNLLSAEEEIAGIYVNRGMKPIWTGGDEENRRRLRALTDAVRNASSHGLPYGQADAEYLVSLAAGSRGARKEAQAESEINRFFVRFATSLHSGAIDPSVVTDNISRKRQPADLSTLMAGITGPDPAGFLETLAPDSAQYLNLRRELKRLDTVVGPRGWGETAAADQLKPGQTGPAVIQLRNRLIRMGYLERTSAADYSEALEYAVKRFQNDHGFDPDGIADQATLAAINVQPPERRRQIVAALERERWLNRPLGEEHIRVNIADFRAEVIREGKAIFSTRVVVGQSRAKLQTPEFSDVMTHMVINPTWYVPRSIATQEILPKLKEDPAAEPLLQLFVPELGTVDRNALDFADYSINNFPFEMKQPPGPKNALGLVKFMFPNRFNVYMHDTPARNLFQRETRNFSHGCIRVHRAQDFARFLLSQKFDYPNLILQSVLASGSEQTIGLAEPLPVHITYRTAFVTESGRINFRNDIYGRDAMVYDALAEARLTPS